MKTTIDIPEPLYKQAKIRAIQTGHTLRQLVLASLSHELDLPLAESKEEKSFWGRRQLLPEYENAMKAGALRPIPGTRDVTELISEDRNAR